jgi:hypothetical protein
MYQLSDVPQIATVGATVHLNAEMGFSLTTTHQGREAEALSRVPRTE